uniref:Uncharacterized protein n=1 Tax=Glossina pallidipes TaxID=7398 RepID=A0A1B0A1K9_GLOPL
MDKKELEKKITREVFKVVYTLTNGYDKKYIPESKILSEVKQRIANSRNIPKLKILVHECLENLRNAGVFHQIDPERFSVNQLSSDAACDFAQPSEVKNLMCWIGSRKRRFSNTSLHTEDTQAAPENSLRNDEVKCTCKRLRTNSGDVLNVDDKKPVMKLYEMCGLHPHLNMNLAGSACGENDRQLDQHLEKISFAGSVYSIGNEHEFCSCSESPSAESLETTNTADELTQTIDNPAGSACGEYDHELDQHLTKISFAGSVYSEGNEDEICSGSESPSAESLETRNTTDELTQTIDNVGIPTKNKLEHQPPFQNDGKASGDDKIKDECVSHSESSSEQQSQKITLSTAT